MYNKKKRNRKTGGRNRQLYIIGSMHSDLVCRQSSYLGVYAATDVTSLWTTSFPSHPTLCIAALLPDTWTSCDTMFFNLLSPITYDLFKGQSFGSFLNLEYLGRICSIQLSLVIVQICVLSSPSCDSQ